MRPPLFYLHPTTVSAIDPQTAIELVVTRHPEHSARAPRSSPQGLFCGCLAPRRETFYPMKKESAAFSHRSFSLASHLVAVAEASSMYATPSTSYASTTARRSTVF